MHQVNRSHEYYLDIAGKGINVSRDLAELHASVIHLTHLGGDFKRIFLKQAKKLGFSLVYVDSQTEIRFCYTLIELKNNNTTEIVEQGEAVDCYVEKIIIKVFNKYLPRCQAIIISGSKAPGFSDQIFPFMVDRAKALNKIMILDYRGKDLLNSIQYNPHVIKPNLSEFIYTFFPGMDEHQRDKSLIKQIKQKIKELYQKYNITTILTDGANPIIYNHGSSIYTHKPQTITPINTMGCGDAFTAGFAHEYLNSSEITQAVKCGEECAQRNAMKIRPGAITEFMIQKQEKK